MDSAAKPERLTDARVAANLRRLRRGMSTYELSRKLGELGWHIRPVGLTNIENGNRQVSVDDLLALSIALGVSANRLLMPEESLVATNGGDHAVAVVGDVCADVADAWRWATGEKPLVRRDRENCDDAGEPSRLDVAMFRIQNRPHDWMETYSKSRAALRAVLDSGVPVEALREHLDQLVGDEVREAAAASEYPVTPRAAPPLTA